MGAARFTWLHLTDLHVGEKVAAPRWNNAIEQVVLRDIERVTQRTGPIHAILFTGDLTQRGDAEEFAAFDLILRRIRAALPQDVDPVFVAVPGNHDLTRPDEGAAVIRALHDWTADPSLRRQFWTDPASDYRVVVGRAFSNWSSWADRAIDWDRLSNVQRDAVLPGDFLATIEAEEHRIGLLGLNTAALQLEGGPFEGRLCINGVQVSALVDRLGDWCEAHDAAFLLTHHDPSWLDEDGSEALRGEIAVPGRFVAHLCGHRHAQARTLVVEGGAVARRLVVGRSLFGIDWYGDHVERRHGYSIGSVLFDERGRTLRFWPRWDIRKQAGHIEIESDQSDTLLDDGGTPPEELGPSPRRHTEGRSSDGRKAEPPGWVRIDQSFLDKQAAAAEDEDLLSFFGGEDPQWPEVASGRIPMLSAARRLVDDIESARDARVTVHLVVGPGGEGKTTAVMQAAASLGRRNDWTTLWRTTAASAYRPARLRWADLRAEVRDGAALCVVVDDAHDIRRDLDRFLARDDINRLLASRGASVHVLLCAHEDEWERARPYRERWRRTYVVSTLEVRGLAFGDARAVVAGYRASGSLEKLDATQDDESLAVEMVERSRSRASSGDEAAFLGAVIECRTGVSFEVHVERILERVARAGADAGLASYPVDLTP